VGISTVFSSPELKAQVSFSDHPLSVCLLDFYISNFFSRTTGPILKTLAKIILRQRGFRIVQMMDNFLPQREIIAKEKKNTLNFFKNLLQNQ
jgi:hypothetical protein